MNELKLIRIAAELWEIAGVAHRGEYEWERLKILRKELKEIAIDYQSRSLQERTL